jgi:hypothetical protein
MHSASTAYADSVQASFDDERNVQIHDPFEIPGRSC